MSDVRIIRLDREAPATYLFLPEYLDRIEKFAREYETDGDPVFLRRAVERDFAADERQFCLLAAVGEQGMLGHMLAGLQVYYLNPGRRLVMVLQYEWESKRADPAAVEQMQAMIKDWANLNMCTEVKALVLDEVRARRFESYGFKREKYLLGVSI